MRDLNEVRKGIPKWHADDTDEELERYLKEVEKATKYYRCESCGAKRGERCNVDFLDPKVAAMDSDMPWHLKWDAHQLRRDRWVHATELERAMLEAALE